MTVIRPVTQRIPSSIDVIEKSSLPFSCVISPYADNPALPHSSHRQRPQHTTTTTNNNDDDEKESSNDAATVTSSKVVDEEHVDKVYNLEELIPSASIPKCSSCGAILNPCSPILSYPTKSLNMSSYRRLSEDRQLYLDDDEEDDIYDDEYASSSDPSFGLFLCGLCGHTTSFHPSVQIKLRPPPSSPGGSVGSYAHHWAAYKGRYQEVSSYTSSYIEQEQRSKASSWRNSIMRLRSPISNEEMNKTIAKNIGPKLFPECHNHVVEFSVPLRERQKPIIEDIANAQDCPPLLSYVIMDPGQNPGQKLFFPSICKILQKILETAPYYAHIGIFIASGNTLSVFDLNSPMPHLKHISLQNGDGNNSSLLLSHVLELSQVYVPFTPEKKRNIEIVLRALQDPLVVNSACRRSVEDRDVSPEIGKAISSILDFVEYGGGMHPGMTPSYDESDFPYDFEYAGGKIMVFLPQAPGEIVQSEGGGDLIVENGGSIGQGGFGGACAQVGKRFQSSFKGCPEEEEHQINSEFLDYFFVEKAHVAEYFVNIGDRAAGLAFGIEIFALDEQTDSNEEDITVSKSFGIPLLAILSKRSGGCGPLMTSFSSLDQDENGLGEGGTFAGLCKEVLARCPWGRPTCFGAMLRVRTSPSFAIDKSSLFSASTDQNGGNNEFALYSKDSGMIGNCYSDPDESDLWHFGACGMDSTLAFDFEITSPTGVIGDHIEQDGNVFDLPPCVQTSFLYTAVVPKGNTGEYVTVRRLRTLTTNLDIAENTEQLFMSLDAEALATILFHKMVSSSLNVGLMETQILGKNWLLSALLSVYKSAEDYNAQEKRRGRVFVTTQDETTVNIRERLLREDLMTSQSLSDLSVKDVLLAQGHEVMSSLPLLLFSLLQCDAMRPTSANCAFHPTFDSRICAITNMSIMPPSILARVIAPRLEIWASGGKEPVLESVRMNQDSLSSGVQEVSHYDTTENSPIIFLDSPWLIMLYQPQVQSESNTSKDDFIERNKTLLQTVNTASDTYRVSPPIIISSEENINHAWERFCDVFVEDSIDGVGEDKGYTTQQMKISAYDQFCANIANTLHEELLSSANEANA